MYRNVSSDTNSINRPALDVNEGCVCFQLSESSSREEQLRQQMTEKEEKIKKSFLGAKTKIHQLNSEYYDLYTAHI